jgi:hypothetical protein
MKLDLYTDAAHVSWTSMRTEAVDIAKDTQKWLMG